VTTLPSLPYGAGRPMRPVGGAGSQLASRQTATRRSELRIVRSDLGLESLFHRRLGCLPYNREAMRGFRRPAISRDRPTSTDRRGVLPCVTTGIKEQSESEARSDLLDRRVESEGERRQSRGRCKHEIEHPLAIVIGGGLVTSTFRRHLIVPTLCLRGGRGTTGIPAHPNGRFAGRLNAMEER
jgi:hypothetical protein